MEIGGQDSLFDNINVTPLVDVFLVLLIIFMVAASIISEQAIPVEVPEVSKAPEISKLKNVTITINETGRLYIGNEDQPLGGNITDLQSVTEEEKQGIVQAIKNGMAENEEMFVVVRAYKQTEIKRVMEVVDIAKNLAGAPNVAIGVSPDQSVSAASDAQ